MRLSGYLFRVQQWDFCPPTTSFVLVIKLLETKVGRGHSKMQSTAAAASSGRRVTVQRKILIERRANLHSRDSRMANQK